MLKLDISLDQVYCTLGRIYWALVCKSIAIFTVLPLYKIYFDFVYIENPTKCVHYTQPTIL